jgi:hypothetical protein
MKQESETWRPDIEDNDTQHVSKKMTSGSKTIWLSAIVPSVVMLNVVAPKLNGQIK